MCHLYPYNNVKLLRKFFYINHEYEYKNGNESSKQACKQRANYAIHQNKHTTRRDGKGLSMKRVIITLFRLCELQDDDEFTQ